MLIDLDRQHRAEYGYHHHMGYHSKESQSNWKDAYCLIILILYDIPILLRKFLKGH